MLADVTGLDCHIGKLGTCLHPDGSWRHI